MPRQEPLYPHVPKGRQPSYAPYSKESWLEHRRHHREFVNRVRLGLVTITGAFITNPHYGGYSFREDSIHGSADYVAPEEVLEILNAAKIDKIHLAGGWWTEVGYKGWGEEIAVSLAKESLPRWKAAFLGKLPKTIITGGE